jgi:DNA-binding XRE family transcriptional regulator
MLDKLLWPERIRHERLKRGWSQEMAAEHLGVSARTLRDWETGRHVPNHKCCQQLICIYGRSIEELGLLDPKLTR